jgi:potassium efflux system protein
VRPGDVIELEGDVVKIDRMGIRASVVRTRDGEDIVLPNSVLVQSAVKNFTLVDDRVRTRVPVGVIYATDLNLAYETLLEAARGASEDIAEVDGSATPEVFLVAFGDNSVNLEVAVWILDAWAIRRIRSQIAMKIWWALKERGIVIAFPQLDVHFDAPIVSGIEALSRRVA